MTFDIILYSASINHQKFNTGNKDWFKDVVAIGESQNQFLMFGQTQTITLAKSMFEEEKINTSNLWMILVNENGAKISELTLENQGCSLHFGSQV